MSFMVIFIIIFGNFWIWKVFSISFLTFLLAIISCFFLSRVLSGKTQYKIGFLITILPLVIIQINHTNIKNLNEFSNDEIRVRDTRLSEYPPLKFPLAYWLEGKPETVALRRIHKNLFEELDVNTYFFGSHPRARVGFEEFERYHYIFLPFFIAGAVHIARKQKWLVIVTVALLAITSFFGTSKILGTLSLFPIITIAIVEGFKRVLNEIR